MMMAWVVFVSLTLKIGGVSADIGLLEALTGKTYLFECFEI